MFGMSLGELIVIGVVALIVFGPERLPEIASKVGKMAGQFKKTSDSYRREFYNAVYIPTDEIKSIERDIKGLVVDKEKPIIKEDPKTLVTNREQVVSEAPAPPQENKNEPSLTPRKD